MIPKSTTLRFIVPLLFSANGNSLWALGSNGTREQEIKSLEVGAKGRRHAEQACGAGMRRRREGRTVFPCAGLFVVLRNFMPGSCSQLSGRDQGPRRLKRVSTCVVPGEIGCVQSVAAGTCRKSAGIGRSTVECFAVSFVGSIRGDLPEPATRIRLSDVYLPSAYEIGIDRPRLPASGLRQASGIGRIVRRARNRGGGAALAGLALF